MSQGEHGEGSKAPASFLCDYLGISRQGYYKHADRSLEVDVLSSRIVLYAREVLKDMPKAGMRELHELCRRHFGQKFTIGRDQCYEIFRSNGLCQRKRKRPRTTCSNHNHFIHGDLLNTTPKLVATRFGQLCVADITYVATNAGWAYLSLLTDAASRSVPGWSLQPTLGKEGPIGALNMALERYRAYGVDVSRLIHHSDRGVQYCCNEYVSILKAAGVRISMTQTGGRPTAQRPGREDEQHHKERLALRHAGQEPRRGQAAHRKSRADVQHPTSTSGPGHENATARTPKAHLTCDIAPLALGSCEPPAAGHPLGVFHGLVFIHAKRPAQTWTANKQCLTLQTDGSCKPNLDFAKGHDNLNTT